jgi:lysozyme family protein
MKWTTTTKAGYGNLYAKMAINPSRSAAVTAVAKKILAAKARYDEVEKLTCVPWWFVGLLHYRESNCDFATYLGNGQSLKRKTTIVPKGRGPFASFTDGAVDALRYQGYIGITDWSIEHALYLMEAFNGFGYVGKGVNSPYVWGGTSNYKIGKYVSDGVFSYSTVDAQLGVAPILKILLLLAPTLIGKAVDMAAETINETVQTVANAPIANAPVNTVTTDVREVLMHHGITALGFAAALAGFHNAPDTISAVMGFPFVSGILFAAFGVALNVLGVNKANSNTLTMIDNAVQYIIQIEQQRLAAQAETQLAQASTKLAETATKVAETKLVQAQTL